MRVNNISNNANRQAFLGTLEYNKKKSEKTMKQLGFVERDAVEIGLKNMEAFAANETPKDKEYEASIRTKTNIKHLASVGQGELYYRTVKFMLDVFDKTTEKHYEDELVTYSSEDILELNPRTNVWSMHELDGPAKSYENGSILKGFNSVMDKIKKDC